MRRRRLVTRRAFLIAGGLTAAGLLFTRRLWDSDALRYYGSAIVAPVRHETSRLVNALVPPGWRIRRHFSYLRFEEGVIDRFVGDVRRHIGDAAVNSDFYMRFLLSTDFFQHGADESRVIGYALFFEPGVTYCYNPLSQPRSG